MIRFHWKMRLTELVFPRNPWMTTYYRLGLGENMGLISMSIRMTKLEF